MEASFWASPPRHPSIKEPSMMMVMIKMMKVTNLIKMMMLMISILEGGRSNTGGLFVRATVVWC